MPCCCRKSLFEQLLENIKHLPRLQWPTNYLTLQNT